MLTPTVNPALSFASPTATPPVATTVFMLLAATAHWRALPRAERDALLDDVFARVFSACPGVSLRQYDSGAFGRDVAAVLVWEVRDAADYRDAVSLLHEHELLARPYFQLADTIVAAEHTGP